MTIGVAWLRDTPEGQELWFATDSRVTGDGNRWDDCPKLMLLPRRDSIAGFSGSTAQAYPLLLQVANAVNGYRAAVDGRLEWFDLVGHLERSVNSLLSRLSPDPLVSRGDPEYREFATRADAILIGGYSRKANGFAIRALQYEKSASAWRFTRVQPSRKLRGRTIRIFGDRISRSKFRWRLESLLQQRSQGAKTTPSGLEPLEVIARFLALPESVSRPLPANRRPPTVGGAPQVIRAIPGAPAMPFAVRWTDDRGKGDFLLGRRVFDYERLDVPLVEMGRNGVRLSAPGQWEPTTTKTDV
jgi:hypothetical protein